MSELLFFVWRKVRFSPRIHECFSMRGAEDPGVFNHEYFYVWEAEECGIFTTNTRILFCVGCGGEGFQPRILLCMGSAGMRNFHHGYTNVFLCGMRRGRFSPRIYECFSMRGTEDAEGFQPRILLGTGAEECGIFTTNSRMFFCVGSGGMRDFHHEYTNDFLCGMRRGRFSPRIHECFSMRGTERWRVLTTSL